MVASRRGPPKPTRAWRTRFVWSTHASWRRCCGWCATSTWPRRSSRKRSSKRSIAGPRPECRIDRALPCEVPEGVELSERLPAVLAVVYLIFNEGYAAHTGDALVRLDLCDEAIRLGHMLVELMPLEPEVLGLVALMELQTSRAATRADADGNLVLLADQDRSRWDRARITRGLALLERAGPVSRAGPYQLQAAIAACHARAASWDATDWEAIVTHYRTLAEVAPSPVVELNRAVAIGFARGPAAGLVALDGIDTATLRGYHLLPAARADFLRRLGRWTEAAAEYRRALSLADNVREQRFLTARLAVCEAGGDSTSVSF